MFTKEEFLNHPCFTRGDLSLRGAILGELTHLFSERVNKSRN